MTRFLDPIPQRLICRDGGDSPISGVMTLGTGAAAFYSSPRPGGIGPNQDALALIPLEDQRAVIAVADGMGGLPGGREAAALAVSTLSEALSVDIPSFHIGLITFGILYSPISELTGIVSS